MFTGPDPSMQVGHHGQPAPDRDSRRMKSLRMIFLPRERFPTDRVRLTTLFGRELLARGHAIDMVMQARDSTVPVGPSTWFGREVFVGRTVDGTGPIRAIRRALLGLIHDLHNLVRADASRYEFVLVSDKYLVGAVALILARMRRQRFFFWLTYPYHDAQLSLGRDGIARSRFLALLRGHLTGNLLYRWIVPRSDHLFVQSERMARDFEARGVPRSKMTAIVTGIDLEGVSPATGPAGRDRSRELTIGYLGTLVRQRRPEIMVDMLDELRRRGVTARLLLVGDGAHPADRAAIEKHARALGLSAQIEITGLLPRRTALERVKSADVCISPFRPSPALDVASPTKLVEYMALGIPVVANRHPDQSPVLKESRAGVCVPWGARHFARGVHWIVRRSDSELQHMSARGRQWVESHRSYSRIADEFEDACLAHVTE
jgi:glycosyltransferase involved in cell wall biosynthesis